MRCSRCAVLSPQAPVGVKNELDQIDAVQIAICGVFVKQYRLPKVGYFMEQHSHPYDHVTALSVGIIDVWQDEVYTGRYEAPRLIEIKAGTVHKFQAVVDDVVLLCIHRDDV